MCVCLHVCERQPQCVCACNCFHVWRSCSRRAGEVADSAPLPASPACNIVRQTFVLSKHTRWAVERGATASCRSQVNSRMKGFDILNDAAPPRCRGWACTYQGMQHPCMCHKRSPRTVHSLAIGPIVHTGLLTGAAVSPGPRRRGGQYSENRGQRKTSSKNSNHQTSHTRSQVQFKRPQRLTHAHNVLNAKANGRSIRGLLLHHRARAASVVLAGSGYIHGYSYIRRRIQVR